VSHFLQAGEADKDKDTNSTPQVHRRKDSLRPKVAVRWMGRQLREVRVMDANQRLDRLALAKLQGGKRTFIRNELLYSPVAPLFNRLL
jgi:hypothetical protein